MVQAEAFIEDWKKSYAEVWHDMIKEALDQGFRPRGIEAFQPRSMGSIVQQFLYEAGKTAEMDDITENTKQLSLQHPKQTN